MLKVTKILFLLLFVFSCDYNPNHPGKYHRLIQKIELPSKDFNIELYVDTWGGVYASNYYVIFKAYSSGAYVKLYSKKNNQLKLELIKKSDDSVFVAETYTMEEHWEKTDTLDNGKIAFSSGNKFLGYKYDTILLNLKK